MKWNAADYAANSAVQQTWARELIAQLHLRGDEHILDVGCGDGKVTAEIARAVPRGSVTGVDASPEMIRFARKTFSPGKHPNLEFQVMDARKISFAALSSPASPPQKEERAGLRRRLISNSKPLAPTLSPLGRGEGDKSLVRHGFFQRGVALGGRSSGISARRGLGFASRRAAGGFLRRQRQRAGCFCGVAAGDAAQTLARIFSQDGKTVFLSQPGGL